ncbi:hypothetical protein Peur_031715 [Populus x canadensis]
MKASAETADLMLKRDQAAHLSALAEARKQEESLMKALGVEKECISSVAADSMLADAHEMVRDALRKLLDSEAKLYAAEASRFHRAAERKLREVEAREADLSRHMTAFKTE